MVKALVLEENNRVVELYKKIFEQKKLEAEFVSDTSSCLGRMDDLKDFDFVVLEGPIEMKTGANLEDAIRSANPQQKVFFLSPYMSQRGEGFEAVKNTLDLIDKPFAMISLLTSLEIKSRH